MCWRNFCNFPLVTKTVKSRLKKNQPFFQMSAILKFDFKKKKNQNKTKQNKKENN